MGQFILRRVGLMLITSICLTFIVFFLTNLFPNLEKLAKTQGNFRMSEAEVTSFLEDRGYLQPLPIKYGQWLGVLPGYVIEGKDGTIRGKCISQVCRPKMQPLFVVYYKVTGVTPQFLKMISEN